jgi:diacylglycerol kinase (ATP)
MDNSFEKNNMLKEFYIPTYIFMPESSVEQVPQIPSCPVIVFINTKSGGQLGHDLIVSYRKLLNHAQVHIFKVTIYTFSLFQHPCIFTADLKIWI